MPITNPDYILQLTELQQAYANLPWYKRYLFILCSYKLYSALSDINPENTTREKVHALLTLSVKARFFNSIFGKLDDFRTSVKEIPFVKEDLDDDAKNQNDDRKIDYPVIYKTLPSSLFISGRELNVNKLKGMDMKGKKELENLVSNIRKIMTHFDSSGEVQNQEMEKSLKNLEDNFLEDNLTAQPEYFVGRFAITKEIKNSSVALVQHIAKEIGIAYTANSIIVRPSSDSKYVKIFLNSKGIESHLKQPHKEVQANASANSEISTSLDELCSRINLVMINFNQATSKTQFDEQQNGLKQLKDNYESNRINAKDRYFLGRFNTDREDLKKKISKKTSELPKDMMKLRLNGYDMPHFMAVKELSNEIIEDFIAEQIGFGLKRDDLIVEQSSAANMVKVSIRQDAIEQYAQHTPYSDEGFRNFNAF